MNYQELTDKINTAEEDKKAAEQAHIQKMIGKNRDILDMQEQLLDIIRIDLFKQYPSLKSFSWLQHHHEKKIILMDTEFDKRYDYFGMGPLGQEKQRKSQQMSEQEIFISQQVDKKLQEVPKQVFIRKFGRLETVIANREGFTIK